MSLFRSFLITYLAASLQGELRAEGFPAPAVLSTDDLAEFATLPEVRKTLVSAALDLRKKHNWLKYTFGSADPDRGGFDCSGAMFHLLTQLDYETRPVLVGAIPLVTGGGEFEQSGRHCEFS